MTHPRWLLAGGGAAVLAAVLSVALLLPDGGSACAAPPPATPKKGVATFFSLGGALGNCSYPSPPADDLFVALGPDQYAGAASCGTYIDVTGPQGKVRVKVVDSCPNCPVGHLDLSLTAFKRIADPVQGRVPITYRSVPGAEAPGSISVRVKEGSSKYWLSLLIDNHVNQVASVKVMRAGGGSRAAQREQWNYWTVPSGAGPGPFKVVITDVSGRATTLSGIKLLSGKTQKTSVTSAAAKPKLKKKPTPKPSPPRSSPPASRSPSPAPSLSPSSEPPLESTTTTAVDLAARPASDSSSC